MVQQDIDAEQARKLAKSKAAVARVAAWRKANPEKERALRAAYRAKHKEARAEYQKAWNAKNAEYRAARYKAYREANKERIRLKNAAYRAANKERERANTYAWRAANPEAARAIVRNRRARIAASSGQHTKDDIRRLFDMQGGKCVECRISIKRAYHVDHIMPIILGGSNGPENLQLLCPKCNRSKGAKDPIQWAQMNGRLV